MEKADGGDAAGRPAVSVIVPVFNAEEHLTASLDALLAQSLPLIEIILVDDGSTDGSAELLRKAAQHPSVRVESLDRNRGVSAARNTGLSAATGEYVAFMDADDMVSTTMYETLYREAVETGSDIVSCAIRVVDSVGGVSSIESFPLAPGVNHDHEVLSEALVTAWTTRLLWYPFRSIYRKRMLLLHGLSFNEAIRKGEDSVFNLEALHAAKNVRSVPDALYDYRKHPASATARPLRSEGANLEELGRAVASFYEASGFDARASEDFQRHVLRSDLPTAVVRLRDHEFARDEITRLLETRVVRDALESQRLGDLGAPLRVRFVLILCRFGRAETLTILLRGSVVARRIQRWLTRS